MRIVSVGAALAFFAVGLDASAQTEMVPDSTRVAAPARMNDTAAVTEPAMQIPANDGVFDQGEVHRKRMALSFGLGGGLTYWSEGSPIGTDDSIGYALVPGYNLGLRASLEFLPWLALDARGSFTHNGANSIVDGGSLSTAGGFGAVRFTAPFRHIRPYALLGFGRYHVHAGGDATQLVSGTFNAFVPGLGAAIPTGRNFEVGAEWLYMHLNGETLSKNPKADGGDPSTVTFFLQYRFPV